MIINVIRLRSHLSEEELLRRAKERKPQFEAIPGLKQKYYVRTSEEGVYAGVYVWDSVDSLKSFQASDLAKSIPAAYEILEAPNIESLQVLFQLRDA
jgi:heme-degrading monooxygenase HmoA